MIREPRFTDDLADLPTHKFGPSSLTWWGIIGYMVIEGGFFMLAFATYFFLMGHEQGWPPEGRQAPDLLAGTLFTLVILASDQRTAHDVAVAAQIFRRGVHHQVGA